MRAMLLLGPLTLAVLAGGAAADQEACTKQFQACTVACVTNQPSDRQDACIDACQSRNTACFSAALGAGTEEVEMIEGTQEANEAEASEDAVPPPMPNSRSMRTPTPRPAQRAPRSEPRTQAR